jgi:hypothetical protein
VALGFFFFGKALLDLNLKKNVNKLPSHSHETFLNFPAKNFKKIHYQVPNHGQFNKSHVAVPFIE